MKSLCTMLYTKNTFKKIMIKSIITIIILSTGGSALFAATSDRIIEMEITAPSFIQSVQIASNSDFINATTITPQPVISWDICRYATSCPSGDYPLYVRYLGENETVQYTTHRIINYQAPKPVVAPKPIVQTTPKPEIVVEVIPDPVTPEPVPEVVVEVETESISEPIIEIPVKVPEEATPWAQTPIGQTIAATVASVSLLGAIGTSLSSLFGSSFSLSQLVFLPVRIWNLLLVFLGIRRRSQPWGVVYDSRTKQPLDPVYVQLLNEAGEEIATSITDIQGRFGFLIEKTGMYRLQAGKTNYTFPSEEMQGVITDILYDEVYHGEDLFLDRDGVITKNIPMDPQADDWNQAEKKRMRVGGVSKTAEIISNIIFYGGLVFTLTMTVMNPTSLNIAFTVTYLGMQILRMIGFHPRAYGIIKDGKTQRPIVHGVIKIFNAALQQRVAHAVTDDYGRYYVLVPKGNYYMTIEEKNEDATYETLYTSESFSNKEGIINTSFQI